MKLGIRGDRFRGDEILAIFKMLHANNTKCVTCCMESQVYYINDDNEVAFTDSLKLKVFTIDEFNKKYPYIPGDIVEFKGNNWAIESCQWCPRTEKMIYWATGHNGSLFHLFADEMRPVNCHFMQCKNISDTTQGPTNIPTTYATCSGEDYVTCTIGKYDNVKINIEKGYEMVEENGSYFVRKKPRYPKNYADCCEVLGIDTNTLIHLCHYDTEVMKAFVQLKICRDTYWKVYGEDEELGHPWSPYDDEDGTSTYKLYNTAPHMVELFPMPSKPLLEEFYSNFENLIRICENLVK